LEIELWPWKKDKHVMLYKVPLLLSPQPEGGFTVTSPLLPELVTEGDTVEEALDNVRDALAAVVEAYEDLGRVLPINMRVADTDDALWLETVVTTPWGIGKRLENYKCWVVKNYLDEGEVLTANGLIPTPSRLRCCPIGEVEISNLEHFGLQSAS
jgi:antitoxin HicB